MRETSVPAGLELSARTEWRGAEVELRETDWMTSRKRERHRSRQRGGEGEKDPETESERD